MPFPFIALFIALAVSAAQTLIARAFQPKPPPQELGKRDDDISGLQSDYGVMIPEVYGGMAGGDVGQNGMRVNGNIIWMTDIEERTLKYKKNKVPITEYLYFVDLAVMFGRGPLRIVKIWAESDLIFNLTFDGPTGAYDPDYPQNVPYDPYHPPDPQAPDQTAPERYSKEHPYSLNETLNASLYKDTFIRIYSGNETQPLDPLIEADVDGRLGAGSTPAYLGRCYIVLENFPITKYGFIPTFTALVYNAQDQSFKAICASLCRRVGLDVNSETDFHCIDGVNVRGYLVSSRRSVRSSLEILGQAYNTEFVEANGKIFAIERGTQPEQSINLNDLGAVEGEIETENSEPPQLMDIKRLDEPQLPRSIDVVYADPAKDHRQNTQSDSRQVTRSQTQGTVDLSALCFTADEAKRIAVRELYRAWVEQQSYEFSLPTRDAYLKPTDVLRIPKGGVSHRMRIISIEGSVPGALKFTAVRDEATVYNQIQATGATGDGQVSQVEIPANSIMALMDIPLLADADNAEPGMYFGISTRDRNSGRWAGADLYRERGGDELLAHFNVGAAMGRATTILADADATVFDYVNTVTVDIYDSALTSAASELEVLNGRNRALLGDEIIGFLTATPVMGFPRRYQLSTLLRGRRGTEYATSTHTANERFTLLNGAIQYLSLDLVERNVVINYKAVTVGAELVDAAPIPFTWIANGLKPYSVVMIEGARDGSDNLTITWVRRTRVGGELADGIDIPLGEAAELYEIDILDGMTVVRTIQASSPTASYTAAEQTTDGLTPGDPVDLIIYQISALVGRGFPAAATV